MNKEHFIELTLFLLKKPKSIYKDRKNIYDNSDIVALFYLRIYTIFKAKIRFDVR
jgi:hypothetical protein